MVLTTMAVKEVAADIGKDLGKDALKSIGGAAMEGVSAYFSKHDSMNGTYEQSANLFKLDQLGLYYSDTALTENGLKRVDDFFDRYGYAINDVIQPNPVARPYYTYIQTIEDCYVNKYGSGGATQGSANAKQIQEINDMLKNGVTFWTRQTTSDQIFKYDTLDNSPT